MDRIWKTDFHIRCWHFRYFTFTRCCVPTQKMKHLCYTYKHMAISNTKIRVSNSKSATGNRQQIPYSITLYYQADSVFIYLLCFSDLVRLGAEKGYSLNLNARANFLLASEYQLFAPRLSKDWYFWFVWFVENNLILLLLMSHN